MRKWILLVGISGLAVLVGCGGDDRLSEEEFRQRLQSIDQRVERSFQQFGRQVQDLEEDDELPPEARSALEDAAEAEREAADELADLNPPEEAEDARDDLVEGALRQADELERAAQEEGITPRQLNRDRALEEAGSRIDEALQELRRRGFLPRED